MKPMNYDFRYAETQNVYENVFHELMDRGFTKGEAHELLGNLYAVARIDGD